MVRLSAEQRLAGEFAKLDTPYGIVFAGVSKR